MGARRTYLILLGASIAVAAFSIAGDVGATPAVGFVATTLVHGKFDEVEVRSQSILPNSIAEERQAKAWLSQQKTNGPSDLYVQSNVWQPGGSTGWHIHPGRSLIMVKEGAVTEYDGRDPACKPHVYAKGMSFVDAGGEHVHLIRNEGDVVAQTTAVQLIPAGTVRRIDAVDPGNCHF